MDDTTDRRLTGGIFLAGALLAIAGNALHPFIPPGATPEEFLHTVHDSALWQPVHFALALSVGFIAAGVIMIAARLRDSAGAAYARLGVGLTVVGAPVFLLQLGAIDGALLPALAEQLAEGDAGAAATAQAVIAFDVAALSLAITALIGGAFLALGLAGLRAGVFAPWIRWTLVVGGAAGVIVGALLYLGLADVVTFYAFRLVALAVTIAGFGIGVQLWRGTDGTGALR